MTTRRTPLNRPMLAKITPEAVEAYRIAEANAQKYLGCIRGACEVEDFARCAECLAYLDASRTLSRALGMKPWETSPVHVDQGEAPDWHNPDNWRRAQQLRRALEEAARD